jgi:protein O-GlcNAc transferase
MKKRIISFSLFGENEIYLQGALRNIELIPKVYPNWIARFYVSQEIAPSFVKQLQDLGAEIVHQRRTSEFDGTFWRFLPLADPRIDAVVVRDLDSRVSAREHSAVDEWLASGRTLHIMRDHPLHKIPIPAGMWGGRGGSVQDMHRLILQWNLWEKKGQDQDFLRDVIYPRFLDDCLVHSSFYEYDGETAVPFPIDRDGCEHVGSVIDADRDTLTTQQQTDLVPYFQDTRLRKLPKVRVRPKMLLRAEQWFRNMRKKAS